VTLFGNGAHFISLTKLTRILDGGHFALDRIAPFEASRKTWRTICEGKVLF